MFPLRIGSQAGNGTDRNQSGDQDALPEGEEEDPFHTKELRHWSERSEILRNAHPKDGEAVEGEANGGVVDDGYVEVSGVAAEGSFIVGVGQFQDDRYDGKDWLHLHIFYA